MFPRVGLISVGSILLIFGVLRVSFQENAQGSVKHG